MAGKVAVMAGCCGCEIDDPPPTCAFKVRARSCGVETCPGDPPSEIAYEIYLPPTAPTPTYSGTLDYIAPASPGTYAYHESDVHSGGFGGGVRIKLIPPEGSGLATIDQVTSFTCYYPVGTAVLNVFLSPIAGHGCFCTEDPAPDVGESITLTNRYGAVTLTRDTPAGLYPASPGLFNGEQAVPRAPTFTCVPGVGLCLDEAGGDVPVYWSASTADRGCTWQVGYHYPAASFQSTGCSAGETAAIRALATACATACHPYASNPEFTPIGVPGTITYADSLTDPCYTTASGWGWRYGNPALCGPVIASCVSRVPVLHEVAIPGCHPCAGTPGSTVPRCDFGPFTEPDGDLWTLTETPAP